MKTSGRDGSNFEEVLNHLLGVQLDLRTKSIFSAGWTEKKKPPPASSGA